jgi:hypothetical protein
MFVTYAFSPFGANAIAKGLLTFKTGDSRRELPLRLMILTLLAPRFATYSWDAFACEPLSVMLSGSAKVVMRVMSAAVVALYTETRSATPFSARYRV